MINTVAAELDRLLVDFSAATLARMCEQIGGADLHFVRAGSQATLMEGGRAIGMITIRDSDVVFAPPLFAGRTGIGRKVTQDDLCNWVIEAWQTTRQDLPTAG